MLSRRQFLTGLASLPLLSCLPQLRPNIVLILADDIGYGDLGCYGQQIIQTPHLDAMAAGGLRFTQAYSNSPVCAPSRWSLMTGQPIGQAPTAMMRDTVLRPEDATIAEQLKIMGYSTACIGKWGLGEPERQSSPGYKGFENFYGYMTHKEAQDYYLPYIWHNDTILPVLANRNGGQGAYIPDLLNERALQFVSQAHQPFFLYYSLNLVHLNSALGNQGQQVPSDAPYSDEAWPQHERNFAAMVTRMDAYIGQIIQALPANTLVIFASDNGGYYEGGHSPMFFNSNGGLNRWKGTLYEGGIRVPLIVSGPGIAPGIETRPAWLSTFSSVALSGDAGRFIEPGPMYWAYDHQADNWPFGEAVRLGDWKGIRYQDKPFELYGLAADPGEATNLAAGQPEMVWQMGAIMDKYCPAPKRCELRFPWLAW